MLNKGGVSKRVKLSVYLVLLLITVLLLFLVFLESTGRTNIVADYYAPSVGFDLTDGKALSAEDIQDYVKSRNPNINENVGLKLAHYCQKLDVNPTFVLAIAEADSSNGLAGVGKSYKNPGNTKISYGRLDQLGIGHAGYRGENNFAVFNSWADGYSAIAVTLANYSYYNMRGQLEPILRTYAGHPNPNYYATVRGVMNKLLAQIDIRIKVNPSDNGRLNKCRAILRKDGRKIKEKKIANRNVTFNNLPRSQYLVRVSCDNYRTLNKRLTSISKTNELDFTIIPQDRAYISGRIERLISSFPDNEGISLILSGEDGGLVSKTKTAKNGYYYFGNLVLGKYVVSVEPEVSFPTGFYYTKKVDLTEKPQEDINFYY